MSQEKRTVTFFQKYQKKNIMQQLKETIENIIHPWLTGDDEAHARYKNLHQLASMDINSNIFPKDLCLPEFIMRFWLDPHQALDTLDKNISKDEIRTLIKETVKQMEANSPLQKPSQYT